MKLHTLAIATLATVALATSASANSSFSLADTIERSATLELGQVVAEGDGVINLYSFHRGQKGALLGSQPVNSGSNYDVHVGVGLRPTTDVLAELVVNGRVVASQDYDIDRF